MRRAGPAAVAATVVWMGIIADPAPSLAEIRVGVIMPLSGTLAILHLDASRVISAWPKSIAGETVSVIRTNDNADPWVTTAIVRRLLVEYKVDMLVSSPVSALATATLASENNVAHLLLRVDPSALGVGQPVATLKRAPLPTVIFEHMKANKVARVGVIGFSDSWGDLWMRELQGLGTRLDLQLVAAERYGRADSSVAVQARKLVAAKPDAILVAASGSASMLPQLALRELGFLGPIYHTHDTATHDFIRLAGPFSNSTFLPATGSLAIQIRIKEPYEVAPAGGQAAEVGELLKRIVPVALHAGRPGTGEFRAALRKAAMAATGKVEDDPTGDKRVWILVTVKGGQWTLAK
jgi:branched-chain amino acid transport system substrate-binding protein